MKKIVSFLIALTFITAAYSQEDIKTLQQTARTFMMSGDFDNSIIVLTRALQQDPKNLELQKDLVMSYYLKRDYVKALDGVKSLIDRDDADVQVYQIAGNVYKALEEVKDADKIYKKGLKKFPKSGPLYSEYGELLWAVKDYSAIRQWEEGIKVDPAYSGNYYNAAMYYFYTRDKTWSLVYGEIFINMESMGERGAAMKQLLYKGYKEKLFADVDMMKDQDDSKSDFARAFLQSMGKQSSLANKGITLESLSMIRARFILDWFATNAYKYPYRLFDFQRQLLTNGMFNAYNQWLFGPVENLAAYENWIRTNADEYNAFSNFQKSRVFRMPGNQYYQVEGKSPDKNSKISAPQDFRAGQ